MSCDHSKLRCTNNEYFCLRCGAKVAPPIIAAEPKAEAAEPKPKQRRRRKDENNGNDSE